MRARPGALLWLRVELPAWKTSAGRQAGQCCFFSRLRAVAAAPAEVGGWAVWRRARYLQPACSACLLSYTAQRSSRRWGVTCVCREYKRREVVVSAGRGASRALRQARGCLHALQSAITAGPDPRTKRRGLNVLCVGDSSGRGSGAALCLCRNPHADRSGGKAGSHPFPAFQPTLRGAAGHTSGCPAPATCYRPAVRVCDHTEAPPGSSDADGLTGSCPVVCRVRGTVAAGRPPRGAAPCWDSVCRQGPCLQQLHVCGDFPLFRRQGMRHKMHWTLADLTRSVSASGCSGGGRLAAGPSLPPASAAAVHARAQSPIRSWEPACTVCVGQLHLPPRPALPQPLPGVMLAPLRPVMLGNINNRLDSRT